MMEGRLFSRNPRRRGDGGRHSREEESPPKEVLFLSSNGLMWYEDVMTDL
jgi:hypothetical protein